MHFLKDWQVRHTREQWWYNNDRLLSKFIYYTPTVTITTENILWPILFSNPNSGSTKLFSETLC